MRPVDYYGRVGQVLSPAFGCVWIRALDIGGWHEGILGGSGIFVNNSFLCVSCGLGCSGVRCLFEGCDSACRTLLGKGSKGETLDPEPTPKP